MTEEMLVLSPEGLAGLVAPWARAELLEVVREVAVLLPLAAAVVATGDQPGTEGPEPARTGERAASDFQRMADRVRQLPLGEPLRTRLMQLLDYHAELIGQAALMAYGDQTERTERALGSRGLGQPAIELARLADRLGQGLDSTWRALHPREDE
jgi:hypothetical protein